MRGARWAAVAVPAIALLWAGIAIGISFIEAPVKFQAPTLTREVGLDVGRHVFAASHVVQLLLGLAALVTATMGRVSRTVWLLIAGASLALLVQHLLILPALDERARIIIAGGQPGGASPHAAYVVLEVTKVLCLLAAAMRSLGRHVVVAACLLLAACSGDFTELVPPTVDGDASLPYADINGTRLHLQTYGTPGDPVVVVLHGGPGHDHRSLLPLAALADAGFFVVLWDQRGTGLSRRHDCDELTARHYLGDLEALVDRYAPVGGPPLFLVGHSWGAMYATWFIHEHPERVRAAVLVEPGGFTRAEVDAYFGALFTSAPLSEALGDGVWSGRLLTPDDHARADLMSVIMFDAVSDPLGMSDVDPMPSWRGGGVVATCMPPTAGDFDWTPGLDRYPGEILFLHGDHNQVLPRQTQERIAAHYGHVTLREIAGTGHDLHWVARDQFVELTRAHLEAQLGQGDRP